MQAPQKNNKESQINKIQDNSFAILYQNQNNSKLIQLRAGDKYQATNGAYRHFNIVNQPWGSNIQAFNKPQNSIFVLQPKSTLITQSLARKTQILYAMDNSAIVFKLNIIPGCKVIQAGTGSGSLSCAISQSLGQTGHLFTFQFNKQRQLINKKLFQDLKKVNITSNWRDVVQDGFSIQGKQIGADALFLDVPNPWAAITHAKNALKKNGRICCFSPCIEQVQKTASQLRKQNFKKVQTYQCLSRQLKQEDLQLQNPLGQKKRMKCSQSIENNRGHTGFLLFAIA